MIWRILGTVGAATFIFSGFSTLADPSCISADIGGGRAVILTCRSDNFGAFSGGTAGFIFVLIGIGLLSLIYWRHIQGFFGHSNSRDSQYLSQVNNSNRDTPSRTTSIKSCDKCGKQMDVKWGHCPVCLGTTFTHKQRELRPFEYTSEEAMLNAFPPVSNSTENSSLEFKDCPMCAEQIKFAAIKCRYCGSMIQ